MVIYTPCRHIGADARSLAAFIALDDGRAGTPYPDTHRRFLGIIGHGAGHLIGKLTCSECRQPTRGYRKKRPTPGRPCGMPSQRPRAEAGVCCSGEKVWTFFKRTQPFAFAVAECREKVPRRRPCRLETNNGQLVSQQPVISR